MTLKKPDSIAKSRFKSAKWDEITDGRNFRQSDVPQIALLCTWYEVIEKASQDLTYDGDIQIAYQNDVGDIKEMPQLNSMKKASAEIRALNKQLGINDEVKEETKRSNERTRILELVTSGKREVRAKTG